MVAADSAALNASERRGGTVLNFNNLVTQGLQKHSRNNERFPTSGTGIKRQLISTTRYYTVLDVS